MVWKALLSSCPLIFSGLNVLYPYDRVLAGIKPLFLVALYLKLTTPHLKYSQTLNLGGTTLNMFGNDFHAQGTFFGEIPTRECYFQDSHLQFTNTNPPVGIFSNKGTPQISEPSSV